MTTARMTVGTVLGTITETAATLTNAVKTASDAVSMANRFVESAATDQRDRQVTHRKTFRDNLLRDARMEVAKSNAAVLAFCSESAEQAKLYEQATAYLPDDIFG